MKLHPLAEYWFSGRMHDIMPQARGNLTVSPNCIPIDFQIFLFFFLQHQLFKTNQNMGETLSILMGLKEGDCVRKVKVKIKQCESSLCKSGNLSNSNVPVIWINRIKNRVWDRVSVWIFHTLFEKQIIETNTQISTAIINFKFVFYEGTLELAYDCK